MMIKVGPNQLSWPSSKQAPTDQLNKRLPKNAGQVVIEYVLLLVIVASLGAILIRDLVSRDPAEPGLFVAKWNTILKKIGDDNPEE